MFVFGLAADAWDNLRARLLDLVAIGHGWDGRIAFAGLCLALAAVSMPRIVLGATGWTRSLPSTTAATRRAAVAALCTTQGFAVFVGLVAPLAALVFYHARLSAPKLVALPLMVTAAAMLVLPVRNTAGPIFALAALILAVPGGWLVTVISAIALLLADRTAGAVVPLRRRRSAHPSAVARGSSATAPAAPIRRWIAITIRALPTASAVGALLLPAALVLFAWAVRRHAPAAMPGTTIAAIRACGAVALAALVAGIANVVLKRRPVWPWSRSLPWSARQRVIGDFALLAGVLLLVPLALLLIAPIPALDLVALVPPVAASGAAALRSGAHRLTGAAAECVAITAVLGALVGISPVFCAPILLVTAPLLFIALRRERTTPATRWNELHHDAAGDPAWAGMP